MNICDKISTCVVLCFVNIGGYYCWSSKVASG